MTGNSNYFASSLLYRFRSKDKRLFILFSAVVALLIPDTMINYVSDFIYPQLVKFWGVALFVLIAILFCIGQYYILNFVRRKSKEMRSKDLYLKTIHIIVTAAQSILAFLVILVVLEILFTSQYHTSILTVASAINLLLTMGILGLFAQRFFAWFKSNRSSVVVLLYGASFAATALGLVLISHNNLSILLEKQPYITPEYEVVFPSDHFEPGSLLAVIYDAYGKVDLLSFGLLIAATALLLHHYSRKLGKLKFWTAICLPMVYFLAAASENLGIYQPETDTEFFYFYLLTSLNSTAGGILFGVTFWTVGKTMREGPVRDYLIIAAYGFVLFFISNQVGLTPTPYPPFGLATQSFLVLASYLIFLGVYSTARSISQDNQLRRSIKKLATQDTNLLSSIGTAQMEQEIQKTVNSMKGIVQEQEKKMEEQTGIEANLEEDEMKKYLEEVMQEVGKAKRPETT